MSLQKASSLEKVKPYQGVKNLAVKEEDNIGKELVVFVNFGGLESYMLQSVIVAF